MSQPVLPLIQSQYISLPRIHIHSASPVSRDTIWTTPRRGNSLPEKKRETTITTTRSEAPAADPGEPAARPTPPPTQAGKRSAISASLGTEQQQQQDASRRSIMAAGVRASRHSVETLAKKASPPARKPCKTSAKDINWADVTDPEERRRIQNRIAQRKFREKARENREKAERESRNREHAGNSYRIPLGAVDLGGSGYGHGYGQEEELSGLPWGGMNLSLVVSRGHEAESRRSSGRGTYIGDEPLTIAASPPFAVVSAPAPGGSTAPSYGSSGGGDDIFFDDASYAYDAAAFPPLA
ncbi:Basic-leucine zipper (bZIP) transcription factor [Hirsutella rhossiliensis]|uniref:Basic-leucine zipper (BZIP) transcription factor n=1 Tax=Hirsutella rhossiliensis TaxID=111463 RepID=A0A9P8MYV4_9HYPO|nr:Basic-leucine zipper (bZIP) transcription factor [Hirsutella rhossiliensis]KAH0964928.1 Basic-leucine zipper (bZIP) transcription factor [Hirsutella rhossiliensis]